jgi:hypothetical protein
MISTIKKIFDKKKQEKEEPVIILAELGSALKNVKSSVNESKKTESWWIGSFGATGSVGHIGSFGTSGATGLPAFYKIDDEIEIRPYVPELAPPGSYPSCATLMFQTHKWIKRDYLKPIGRSRVTGETIYKYTGFKPQEDLGSIGIDYYELV